MGIVIKQSFWSSISSYIGVLVGYLNAALLMPKYMSADEIGLFRVIISISFMIVPFVEVGMSSTLIRFYSKYNKENAKKFIGLTMVTIAIAYIFFISIFYLFRESINVFFEAKSDRLNDYLWLVGILVFQMVTFNFIENLFRIKLSIIASNFLRDLVYKLLHTVVILLFATGRISFHEYLISHIFLYFLLLLILVFTLLIKKKMSISFTGIFRSDLLKPVFNYSIFAFMGGMGMIMVIQVDQIMISRYLGLTESGIYATAIYFTLVTEIPRKFIGQITQPLLGEAFSRNDHNYIDKQYKNISLHQFLLGAIVFLFIVTNLRSFYAIMPNGEVYSKGMWVVIILGATKLVDMVFSSNSEILNYSVYYKFNTLLMLLLAFLVIGLNILLIPPYGINGAAIATLIAFTIFNIVKFIFIKIKLRYDPFTRFTVLNLIVGLFVYFACTVIPSPENAFLSIITKGLILVTIYFFYLYFVRPSPEIYSIIDMVLKRTKRILTK